MYKMSQEYIFEENNPTGCGKPIKYIINENDCYVVTSHSFNQFGHARIYRNEKQTYIHRLVYETLHGDILENLVVRHKCDNPRCINVDHLELGTKSDNNKDRDSRNRTAKGESSGNVRLTEKQVKEILINNSNTCDELSKIYEVNKTTIERIKSGKTWRHVYDKLGDKVCPMLDATVNSIHIGEENGSAKLRELDVVAILLDNTSSVQELATKYNVSKSAIHRIKNRQSWRHVYDKIINAV